jgi:hypothetical protein
VPNALNAHQIAQHRILLLGEIGSGKTSQILTLPGKKYVHCFDSNALLTLRGHDIDYDEYLPSPVSAAVSSLAKGKADSRGTTTSDIYLQFERTFDERLKSGFFDQYDWVCFDSATTLLDLIMDRILTLNGRFGQYPQMDDYGPTMTAFTNLCRTAIGLSKGILMTGHLEVKQDEKTKQITNRPMLTGRLVAKIPLLFSDIFYLDTALDEKNKLAYRLQTAPSGMNKTIRTSIRGLEIFEDITLDFTRPIMGQGLGGILQWEQKNLSA